MAGNPKNLSKRKRGSERPSAPLPLGPRHLAQFWSGKKFLWYEKHPSAYWREGGQDRVRVVLAKEKIFFFPPKRPYLWSLWESRLPTYWKSMCFNVVHVCVMFLLFVVCLFLIFFHKKPHGAEHADFKSAPPISYKKKVREGQGLWIPCHIHIHVHGRVW